MSGKSSNSSVAIAGAAMTKFGRHGDRTLTELAQEAANGALRDAGISAQDLDAVVFANSFAGFLQGQEAIRGEVTLARGGFGNRSIWNVENACASGSTGVFTAVNALLAGTVESVLVVGAEKLWDPDRARSFAALESATDVAEPKGSDPNRSIFMDHYAEKAREYMDRFGATAGHFARVAVENSEHGALNPFAHHRTPHTLEEVLESRPIVDPLTLFMCSPISDGAAAVVLTAESASEPGRPRIEVCSLRAGDGHSDPTAAAAAAAFDAAGIAPDEIDLLELHDATAPSQLIALEDIGFCGPGEAMDLMSSRDSSDLANLNPSGGLLSRGHPVGATGVAQIVEVAWQLQGRAEGRQVPGAEVAACQNSGGVLGNEVAVACVTVVRK